MASSPWRLLQARFIAIGHIALGQGFEFTIEGDDERARVNKSEIHIDFMIGSDDVSGETVQLFGDVLTTDATV